MSRNRTLEEQMMKKEEELNALQKKVDEFDAYSSRMQKEYEA